MNAVAVPVGRENSGSHRAPRTGQLLADPGASAPRTGGLLADLGCSAPPPVRCSPTAPTARQNTVARWPHGPAGSPRVRRRADTQVLARRIGRTRATPVPAGCRARGSTAPIPLVRAPGAGTSRREWSPVAPPGTGARRSWADPAPAPDRYIALASPGSPRPPCNAPRSVRRSPTPVDSTPRRSAPRPASADRDSSHSPFRWSIS
jgi:hypothetical protein